MIGIGSTNMVWTCTMDTVHVETKVVILLYMILLCIFTLWVDHSFCIAFLKAPLCYVYKIAVHEFVIGIVISRSKIIMPCVGIHNFRMAKLVPPH